MKKTLRLLLSAIALSAFAQATERWVDQNAAAGGNGSSNAPFQTISAAITASSLGDTVTIRNGIYRERVNPKSGLPGQPFTIQAAAGTNGTNVVISGFKTIENWQPYSGSIYTTTANFGLLGIRDLFVGYKPQWLSRDTAPAEFWHKISDIDATKTIFTATNMPFGTVSGTNMFLFGIEGTGNRELHMRLANVNPVAQTVTLTSSNTMFKVGDLFLVCNDPALIDKPGEWSYEPLPDGSTRLYFWPEQTSDLSWTQSSDANIPGPVYIVGCTNVLIRNLEITGNARNGYGAIHITGGSQYVTVSNCVVHDNRITGIYIRGCANVTVSRCVVVRSDHGIVFSGAHNCLVEECEVAFNYGDGINVTGDAAQTVQEFRYADQVVLRNNHVHHHQYLEHPDNVQIYTGVKRFRYENNVGLFCGQQMMTETCDTDLALIGNVLWGTASNDFQGHTDSWNWALWGNLFGFAGWSYTSMPGQDYRCYENIIYGGSMGVGLQYQGDRNVIWLNGTSGNAVSVTSNGVYAGAYSTLAAFTAATGQDQHSVQADPQLANVPISQGYMSKVSEGSVSNQYISSTPSDTSAMLPLEINDLIEINGDGVARTVTQIAADSVYFTPPLPSIPFREGYSLVWRWGTNTNFQLDTRPSPTGAAAGLSARNGTAGSSLLVSDYQAGDFNGDSIRDLPPIPPALQATWPDPNNMVIPYVSPF